MGKKVLKRVEAAPGREKRRERERGSDGDSVCEKESEGTAVSRRRMNGCTGHGTDQLIGGARQSLRVTAANKPAVVRCCSCDVSWVPGSREKDFGWGGERE